MQIIIIGNTGSEYGLAILKHLQSVGHEAVLIDSVDQITPELKESMSMASQVKLEDLAVRYGKESIIQPLDNHLLKEMQSVGRVYREPRGVIPPGKFRAKHERRNR